MGIRAVLKAGSKVRFLLDWDTIVDGLKHVESQSKQYTMSKQRGRGSTRSRLQFMMIYWRWHVVRMFWEGLQRKEISKN